jgi:hypothetical protein
VVPEEFDEPVEEGPFLRKDVADVLGPAGTGLERRGEELRHPGLVDIPSDLGRPLVRLASDVALATSGILPELSFEGPSQLGEVRHCGRIEIGREFGEASYRAFQPTPIEQ